MSHPAGSVVLPTVDALVSLIKSQPEDARRDKALYHLERLHQAFQASHQEAVRFAAFTVNKTVHDATDWDTSVAAAIEALRAALGDCGHTF